MYVRGASSNIIDDESTMKIICVEEHIVDQDLAKAAQFKQLVNAPYFTEVGPGYGGDIEDGDDKRPLPIDFSMTMKLAAEAGTGRIVQMDKQGIDMQILSCSNPPQGAPSQQGVELTRALNDKLAGILQANSNTLFSLRVITMAAARRCG